MEVAFVFHVLFQHVMFLRPAYYIKSSNKTLKKMLYVWPHFNTFIDACEVSDEMKWKVTQN